MKKLRIFDLFTGIAGFSLGIIRALGKENVEIVGFGEIEKDPIAINKFNFKEIKNYEDGKPLPDFDLLVGGSPCQDLSTVGKRKGLFGERSRLFFYFVQLLKEKQPTNFIFENVKGIFSSDRGWDFARVQIEFSEAGYDIEWQLLNSADFGVPQHRERIYIIGHLRGKSEPKVFPFTKSNRPIIKKESKYLIFDGYNRKFTEMIGSLRQNMLNGGSLIVEDNKFRKLTPIECERLQSFPDNWTKFGISQKGTQYEISDNRRYKAVGNAVTVSLVETIVRKLYKVIKEEKCL